MPRNREALPSRVQARDLEADVLERRIAGTSFRQIAADLERPVSTVHAAYSRAIDRASHEHAQLADDVITLELDRLDAMQHAIWSQAVDDGDHGAIRTVLRIMERRARLLGLDSRRPAEHTEVDARTFVDVDIANMTLAGVDLSGMTDDELATLESLVRRHGTTEPTEH